MVALLCLAILAALTLTKPAPASECVAYIGDNSEGDPFFLPCSYVTPTNYPQQWVDRGQDI
jgi:hypothetical protein